MKAFVLSIVLAWTALAQPPQLPPLRTIEVGAARRGTAG